MSEFDHSAQHEIALTFALRRSEKSSLSAGQTYNLYQLFLHEINQRDPLSPEDYEKSAQDYVANLKMAERKAFLGK